MTRGVRISLVLAIALGAPAAWLVCGMVSRDIGHATFVFDVTSRAALDADCASKKDGSVTLADGGVEDRWYDFDKGGDVIFRTLVRFGGTPGGGGRLLADLEATSLACDFPGEGLGRSFLEVMVKGKKTNAQVVELLRSIGTGLGASNSAIDGEVERFEAGDAWNAQSPAGYHNLWDLGPELNVKLIVGDEKGGRDIPRHARSDEARFDVSARFMPAQ